MITNSVTRRVSLGLGVVAVVGLSIVGAADRTAPSDAAPPIALMSGEQPLKDHLRSSVFLSADRLPAGRQVRVAVVLEVEGGWHINTNPARPEFLTPTAVAIKSKHGTTLAALDYPPGKSLRVEGFDEPLSCYDGRVVLFGTLDVPAAAAGQTEELTVEVRFQACNDTACAAPKTAKLVGKVPVAPANEAVRPINVELFDRKQPGAK